MPRQGKKPKAPNRDAVPPGKSTRSGTSLRAVRGFRNNEKGQRNATSRVSERAHRMEPRCKERAAVYELIVCILQDKHPIPVCRFCSAATRTSAIPCPVRHMCAGRIMRSEQSGYGVGSCHCSLLCTPIKRGRRYNSVQSALQCLSVVVVLTPVSPRYKPGHNTGFRQILHHTEVFLQVYRTV